VLGCSVQQVCPSVVAQSAPKPFDHLGFRAGQIVQGREFAKKALPVGQTLFNPGLLQDDFTQPNGIGIAQTTPRQRTSLLVVPREQNLRNGAILSW